MRINDTKKGNLSVHEAINVLLWYYQIIKKKKFETSTEWCFFIWREYASYRERIVVVETICE